MLTARKVGEKPRHAAYIDVPVDPLHNTSIGSTKSLWTTCCRSSSFIVRNVNIPVICSLLTTYTSILTSKRPLTRDTGSEHLKFIEHTDQRVSHLSMSSMGLSNADVAVSIFVIAVRTVDAKHKYTRFRQFSRVKPPAVVESHVSMPRASWLWLVPQPMRT